MNIEYIDLDSEEINSYRYSKATMRKFIDENVASYYYNYKAQVAWHYNNENYSFSSDSIKHMPLKEWDGIALIKNTQEIIICNPDASVRHVIHVPDGLIQQQDFITRFTLNICETDSLSDPRFSMHFLRFDDYFYYEGVFYLAVKVGKYNDYSFQDSASQMRYINPETGEFLPFTKTICKNTSNRWSYNEECIKL